MVQAAAMAGVSRRAPENHHLRSCEVACELISLPSSPVLGVLHDYSRARHERLLGKYSFGSDSYMQEPWTIFKPGVWCEVRSFSVESG